MVAVESAEPLSNATGNVCGAQDGEDDLPEDSLNALDTAFVAKDSGLELADEYVSVNAPNWHPIFHNPLPRIKPEPSSTLYYNDQRLDKQADTRSARLRKSGALDVQTKQFCQVIDVYKRTAKGDGLPADFDVRLMWPDGRIAHLNEHPSRVLVMLRLTLICADPWFSFMGRSDVRGPQR